MALLQVALIGLLVAAALLVALTSGGGLPERLHLALLVTPLVVLYAVAVFTPRVRGWGRRLLRGGLGALLAGAAGFALFLALRGRTDWFRWPDERGGDLFVAILVLLAAIPGGAAAAAATPARGLALAGGFVVGLVVPLVLHGASGLSVLLGAGLGVGVLVAAIAARVGAGRAG